MPRPTREFPNARPYKDRHGKRRWRLRKDGRTAELGTEYGSPEFVRRYEAALAEVPPEPAPIGSSRTRPGTVAALVASFKASPRYRAWAPNTKRAYGGPIEGFREEHGHRRVSHLDRGAVIRLMEKKADTPDAANRLRKCLVMLLDHACDLGLVQTNVAKGVRAYRSHSDGFHTWDEGEIAEFYAHHEPGTLAHTAMTLMLYTGAARVDAVALGWGNIEGGRVRYRRRKTRQSSDVVIDIPLHPDLAAVLATLPKDRFTFLETAQGKARTPEGLGNAMRRWCDAAKLPQCTSHGLRKAMTRRLAEAGATPNQIAAVTGHKGLAEVSRYTSAADRSVLADAAFGRLTRPNGEQTLTNHPARFVKPAGKPQSDQ